MSKLLGEFGTEMRILHQATAEDLAAVAGDKLAQSIMMARNGTLHLSDGGGGSYGKVLR
ncbi:DNA helicase II [Paenibacillus sp. JCM 10914]|nr:DNA helicase II [Paenibacillus sp. JCM 10914]